MSEDAAANSSLSHGTTLIAGLRNCRDLGGLPAGPGARVRRGRVFRSAGLNALTDPERAAIRRLGLRAVLDLRDEYELIHWPDELGDPAVAAVNIAVLGDRPVPPAQRELYPHMIGACGAEFTAAVRVLADGALHPILVHCAVGKDRTGVTVALALAALGVPDDAIIADFLLSNEGLGVTEPAEGVSVDTYQTGRYVSADLITGVLAEARELGGDVPGFLAGHGMTRAELAALREALVEPDDDRVGGDAAR